MSSQLRPAAGWGAARPRPRHSFEMESPGSAMSSACVPRQRLQLTSDTEWQPSYGRDDRERLFLHVGPQLGSEGRRRNRLPSCIRRRPEAGTDNTEMSHDAHENWNATAASDEPRVYSGLCRIACSAPDGHRATWATTSSAEARSGRIQRFSPTSKTAESPRRQMPVCRHTLGLKVTVTSSAA